MFLLFLLYIKVDSLKSPLPSVFQIIAVSHGLLEWVQVFALWIKGICFNNLTKLKPCKYYPVSAGKQRAWCLWLLAGLPAQIQYYENLASFSSILDILSRSSLQISNLAITSDSFCSVSGLWICLESLCLFSLESLCLSSLYWPPYLYNPYMVHFWKHIGSRLQKR